MKYYMLIDLRGNQLIFGKYLFKIKIGEKQMTLTPKELDSNIVLIPFILNHKVKLSKNEIHNLFRQ